MHKRVPINPEPAFQAEPDRLLDKQACLQRVLSSPVLSGSEVLVSLLRYLAERSLRAPDKQIKEHQIATELFDRPDSFDPRTDSFVRVHTSRLRAKLSEYYESEAGRHDPWRVEIPKGSHSVLFQPQPAAAPATVLEPRKDADIARNRTKLVVLAASCLLLGCLIGSGLSFFLNRRNEGAGEIHAPSSLVRFWKAALHSKEDPLVIFSNAQFVGRPETGLRYARPEEVASTNLEAYTGFGELIAVHALDDVFSQLHRGFILKRAHLLNWDEAKNRDLIFIGSPSENSPLKELALENDFAFRPSPGPVRPGDLGIFNLHPRPGEQKVYFATATFPIEEDFGLIVIADAPNPSQRVVLLAGTTTYGTEAAAEFASNSSDLDQLWSSIPLSASTEPHHLSVLLHVKVRRGVPLIINIEAVRAA